MLLTPAAAAAPVGSSRLAPSSAMSAVGSASFSPSSSSPSSSYSPPISLTSVYPLASLSGRPLQDLHPQRASDRFIGPRAGDANAARRADACTTNSATGWTTCSDSMDQVQESLQQPLQQPPAPNRENVLPIGPLASHLREPQPAPIADDAVAAAARARERLMSVQLLASAMMELQSSGRAPPMLPIAPPAPLGVAPNSAAPAAATPMSPSQRLSQEWSTRSAATVNPMSAFSGGAGLSFAPASSSSSSSGKRRASTGGHHTQHGHVAHASSAPVLCLCRCRCAWLCCCCRRIAHPPIAPSCPELHVAPFHSSARLRGRSAKARTHRAATSGQTALRRGDGAAGGGCRCVHGLLVPAALALRFHARLHPSSVWRCNRSV